MTPGEMGFLLLTCQLGETGCKPLTVAQFRLLKQRVRQMERPKEDREITAEDMKALGYDRREAERIFYLLSRKSQLMWYLGKARSCGCTAVVRNGNVYPQRLRDVLGDDAPAVLWAKGDLSLLETPAVALVGSRDLWGDNFLFAREVGRLAAKQGYTLVSGNARGADRVAQDACLTCGGRVISVVADQLSVYAPRENMLYLAENSFDGEFTANRALSRNHIIHALGEKTFVAKCDLRKGGTWSGTYANLKHKRSHVFCFDDGSEAVAELEKLGATLVDLDIKTI